MCDRQPYQAAEAIEGSGRSWSGATASQMLRQAAKWISVVVTGLGAAAICGLALEVEWITGMLPGAEGIRGWSAAALVLGGVGLRCGVSGAVSVWGRRVRWACGTAMAVLMGGALVEQVLGVELWGGGVGSGGARGLSGEGFGAGILIVACFAALGLALALLEVEVRGLGRPTEWLALPACFVSLVAWVWNVYEAGDPGWSGPVGQVASQGAAGLLLLSMGLLFARPERGLMRGMISGALSEAVMPRLVAAALLVPLVSGWLEIMGEYTGLTDAAAGRALSAALRIGLLIAVLVWVGRVADRLEGSRRAAEAEVRQQKALLSSVVDRMADGVVVANGAGEFVLFNPAAEALLGLGAVRAGPAEWTSQYGVFYPDESTPVPMERLPLVRAMRGEAVNDVELFIRNERLAEGHRICVSGRPLGAESGLDGGGIVVFHDVTEIRRAEARILELNQSLEKKVQERTRELERANLRLKRANRELSRRNAELDEFTYVASHDLQEPLRKLTSFAELLCQDLGGRLEEAAARDLEYICDAASRMRQLVQDLLALSRAGRSAMRREEVRLDDCVDWALHALAERVEESGARVTREVLPTVKGDPTLLSQLYQNLIGNALKYRGAEAPEVHLTAAVVDGKWVMGVQDNGIGIPAEYREQIFAPFKRLHGRSEYEGTGIGLAICRRVVQRHGGRIWVEESAAGGSHFKFTLGGVLGVRKRGGIDRTEKPVEVACGCGTGREDP